LAIKPVETSRIVLKLLNLTTRLFLQDSHGITASLAHHALYGREKYDGIEYPDAKSKSFYNFALHPKFADKLELVYVYHIDAEADDTHIWKRIGEVSDGRISWRRYSPEDSWVALSKKMGLRLLAERLS